jgi:hypothetical protein
MNLNHADGLRVLKLAQTRIVKATNRTTTVYTSKTLPQDGTVGLMEGRAETQAIVPCE